MVNFKMELIKYMYVEILLERQPQRINRNEKNKILPLLIQDYTLAS